MTQLDRMAAHGTVTDPEDFSEGRGDHRKSVLASTALIVVLLVSDKLTPAVFGVSVPPFMLWLCVGLAHLYFFAMWRLTATIEADSEKRFWNFSGFWRQATLGGTKGFAGKTKAQYFFIRALPIWAFAVGIAGVAYGLCRHHGAV